MPLQDTQHRCISARFRPLPHFRLTCESEQQGRYASVTSRLRTAGTLHPPASTRCFFPDRIPCGPRRTCPWRNQPSTRLPAENTTQITARLHRRRQMRLWVDSLLTKISSRRGKPMEGAKQDTVWKLNPSAPARAAYADRTHLSSAMAGHGLSCRAGHGLRQPQRGQPAPPAPLPPGRLRP